MKIRPVGADLFHADGQTDKTKLIVAFRNLAKAHTKEALLSVTVACGCKLRTTVPGC